MKWSRLKTQKKIITISNTCVITLYSRDSHICLDFFHSLFLSFSLVFPCFSSPVIPSIICDGWERMVLTCVIFAERTTALCIKALALEILFAHLIYWTKENFSFSCRNIDLWNYKCRYILKKITKYLKKNEYKVKWNIIS